MSEERFIAIEGRIQALATGQEQMRNQLSSEIQQLGHQMRVLHEDTIDRIKALAPDFGPIRREFAEADNRLRQDIDARLVPLEAAVKERRRDPH